MSHNSLGYCAHMEGNSVSRATMLAAYIAALATITAALITRSSCNPPLPTQDVAGVVVDEVGTAIPNARVTVDAGGVSMIQTADSLGAFAFALDSSWRTLLMNVQASGYEQRTVRLHYKNPNIATLSVPLRRTKQAAQKPPENGSAGTPTTGGIKSGQDPKLPKKDPVTTSGPDPKRQEPKTRSTVAENYSYTAKITLSDILAPVQLRVDFVDDTGTKTVLEGSYEPEATVEAKGVSRSKEVTFKIYYDGELVSTKRATRDGTTSQ